MVLLAGIANHNCVGQIIHRELDPQIFACRNIVSHGDLQPDTVIPIDVQNDGLTDLNLEITNFGSGAEYHHKILYMQTYVSL